MPPRVMRLDEPDDREWAGRCWTGIRASERVGVVVVEILDGSIVSQVAIGRLGRELRDLIASGRDRIAVDFGNVLQMSSQVISVLLRAHRLCEAAGGRLKVFGVRPEVAPAFAITGIARLVEFHLDERSAIEGEWPPPMPDPGVRGGPLLADEAGEPWGDPGPPPAPAGGRAADRAGGVGHRRTGRRSAGLWLIAMVGRARGQVIPIPEPRFLMGRDPCCDLRTKNPTVGIIHAILEARAGRVFLRDLGSPNGTVLNDRILYGEEAVACDGDRFGIGPLLFTVAIEPASAPAPADRMPVADGWEPTLAIDHPAPRSIDTPSHGWLWRSLRRHGATARRAVASQAPPQPPSSSADRYALPTAPDSPLDLEFPERLYPWDSLADDAEGEEAVPVLASRR